VHEGVPHFSCSLTGFYLDGGDKLVMPENVSCQEISFFCRWLCCSAEMVAWRVSARATTAYHVTNLLVGLKKQQRVR
jgi:hypothetical protein